jgi:hypothetical protein
MTLLPIRIRTATARALPFIDPSRSQLSNEIGYRTDARMFMQQVTWQKHMGVSMYARRAAWMNALAVVFRFKITSVTVKLLAFGAFDA